MPSESSSTPGILLLTPYSATGTRTSKSTRGATIRTVVLYKPYDLRILRSRLDKSLGLRYKRLVSN